MTGRRLSVPPARAAAWVLAAFLASVAAGALAPAAPAPDETVEYLDHLFSEARERHHIPGLAATVVHRGQVVYARGHGWADEAQAQPMDVAQTIVPVGSISKLLTTMAVLQLAEEGLLDLDADIRRYLPEDLAAGARPAAPVTLRHLMTHTDGYDVRWLFGGAATDPARLPDLAELLRVLPPRILPPGEVYLYSDVGYTIAGYIVERVSGQPFAQQVQQRLLDPLGMATSSFLRPVPEPWLARRATGHEDTYDGQGTNRVVPLVYPLALPSSGLHASADDMTRLMIALLQEGRVGAARILEPGSIRLLTTRQFSHHESIPGTCFGFYEYPYRGEQSVLHGGLMLGFTTVMLLLPERELGLFVAVNKYGLVSLLEEQLVQRVIDHFVPGTAAPPPPPLAHRPGTSAGASKAWLGRYRLDQYSRRSTDRIAVASGLAPEIDVRTAPEGRLRFEPHGTEWQEIEPDLFQCLTTGERVIFRRSSDGRDTRILGSAQFMSYHRLAWYEHLSVQAGLAGGWIAGAVIGALTGALAISGRRSRPAGSPQSAATSVWVCRALALITGAGVMVFVLLLQHTLAQMDITAAFLGWPPAMRWAFGLPWFFSLAGFGWLGALTWAWSSGGLGRRERYGHLAGAVLVTAYIPVLHYWNLLAIRGSL